MNWEFPLCLYQLLFGFTVDDLDNTVSIPLQPPLPNPEHLELPSPVRIAPAATLVFLTLLQCLLKPPKSPNDCHQLSTHIFSTIALPPHTFPSAGGFQRPCCHVASPDESGKRHDVDLFVIWRKDLFERCYCCTYKHSLFYQALAFFVQATSIECRKKSHLLHDSLTHISNLNTHS